MSSDEPVAPAELPRRLEWELTAGVEGAIRDAQKRFQQTVGSTDIAAFETDALTSVLLKNHQLSPDGMLQMAIQLAHGRMHGGRSVATYESASTASFKHGRTETIRSATPESAAFVEAFCDSSVDSVTRAIRMREASANHARVTRDALTGKGMDRHLFALRALAAGEAEPELFRTAAYAALSKIILSTSTLQSAALENGGFGPVNSDCYAIGYNMSKAGAAAMVMSYGRDAPAFVHSLEGAMRDMRDATLVDVD